MNYELMGQFNVKTDEDYLGFYRETLPTVQDGVLSLVWDSNSENARIGFVTKVRDEPRSDYYTYRAMVPSTFPIDESTTFDTLGFSYARPITTKEALKWIKMHSVDSVVIKRRTVGITVSIASYIIGVLFSLLNNYAIGEALLFGLVMGLVPLLVLFILPFIITDVIELP